MAHVERSPIRCDLWHDNIKLHRGALHPFDFEDTTHGFRAHDIAMAMLDLLEDTDDDTYTTLLAAFRRGYESLLAWPDDPIDLGGSICYTHARSAGIFSSFRLVGNHWR